MPRKGKNIYKRKNGRYEGRYITSYDKDGKARYASIYGKSEHEVEERMIGQKTGLVGESESGEITFSAVVGNWLEEKKKKLASVTIDRYEYLLDRYILPEFGDRDVESITETQINAYIVDLTDREQRGTSVVSGTTIENIHSADLRPQPK